MMITFLGFDMRGALLGRARQSSFALLALLGALAGGPAPSADAAPVAETAFEAARLKDDLAGVLTAEAPSARVRFHASAGSKLSITLGKDTRSSTAVAPGLAASLRLADGTDLSTALEGRVTVKPDGTVQWKSVLLAESADYDVGISATGPGSWRLTLAGVLAKTKASIVTDVAPGAEDGIDFQGLARGTLSYKLAATTSKGRFRGEATRIVQPDGTDLPEFAGAASGKVALLQDGLHRLVFANTGSGPGDGKATANVAPPKLVKRTGFLHPDTTALLPVVQKIDPARSFHRDPALPVTITGRDFQPGVGVRLTRNGYDDIVGTSVEVVSETLITCLLDLDTVDTTAVNSIGQWTVSVWNDPGRADPATRNTKLKFDSLNSGSITLPRGVKKNAEVWVVNFNSEFQTDLNRMGFGTDAEEVRQSARNAVEAYTIAYLRDLFELNETNGDLTKGRAVPVCFLVDDPARAAGTVGEDYNRIEVGGIWQAGDERDLTEPLLWGYAPNDPLNRNREDLSVADAAGTRVGRGVRTRVLDPESGQVANSFVLAMSPLRTRSLSGNDLRYFRPNFFPVNQAEADRYKDIVNQISRASREIAAILGHHVAKSMGLATGAATGPLANPELAGEMWPLTNSLAFTPVEISNLQQNAVPHELPGSSKPLTVGYFPLVTTHSYLLEECTTEVSYSTRFGFVGGRVNADRSDYRVQYVAGSSVPVGLRLSFDGLDGKAPLWLNQSQNVYYCAVQVFRVAVTDEVRGGTRIFQFRLNVVPNVPMLPQPLQNAAQQCANTVRSTQ